MATKMTVFFCPYEKLGVCRLHPFEMILSTTMLNIGFASENKTSIMSPTRIGSFRLLCSPRVYPLDVLYVLRKLLLPSYISCVSKKDYDLKSCSVRVQFMGNYMRALQLNMFLGTYPSWELSSSGHDGGHIVEISREQLNTFPTKFTLNMCPTQLPHKFAIQGEHGGR
jgi:hypothetical protein